jgi:hypothetical protein
MASASLEGLRERLRWRLLFFTFLGDLLDCLFGGERERPLEELRERLLAQRRPFDEEPLEPFWVLLSDSLWEPEPVGPWSDSWLEAARRSLSSLLLLLLLLLPRSRERLCVAS